MIIFLPPTTNLRCDNDDDALHTMESAAVGETVRIVHVYDCVWHGVSFLFVAFTSDASDELWPSPKKFQIQIQEMFTEFLQSSKPFTLTQFIAFNL